MRLEVLAASVLALAPSAAFAVDYLSADAAAKLIFPEAEGFDSRTLTLDAAQMAQLAAQGVHARSARWPVRVALRGAQVLGYVVIDNVVGKFELIGYAVGVDAAGALRQIEILSYRESHGSEVRLPAWRRQFVGKTAASALRLGEDISSISGATLSCEHVTEGVRRIAAVLALARAGGLLP